MATTKTHTGQALKALRKAAGLTLSDISDIADTAPAYLSKVENGVLIPAPAYVGRIAAAIASVLTADASDRIAA